MARRAIWSRPAQRDLRPLDSQVTARIHQTVERYVATGFGDLRVVRGAAVRTFRLRVGDYRVIFTSESENGDEVVRILRVHHRRDAYR